MGGGFWDDIADWRGFPGENRPRLRKTERFSHLERFIRREMEAGRDPKEEVKALLERSDPRVVIADEIGCGLVPIDPFERAWREETGRILCALAREAEAVVRVHCGFPQAIKGEWR